MARTPLARGELLPLFEDWQLEPMPLYVAFPPSRHVSRKLRVFIRLGGGVDGAACAGDPAASVRLWRRLLEVALSWPESSFRFRPIALKNSVHRDAQQPGARDSCILAVGQSSSVPESHGRECDTV